jgi:hypothetical protein
MNTMGEWIYTVDSCFADYGSCWRSLVKANVLIGNQTHHLPACSIVPQQKCYRLSPSVWNSSYVYITVIFHSSLCGTLVQLLSACELTYTPITSSRTTRREVNPQINGRCYSCTEVAWSDSRSGVVIRTQCYSTRLICWFVLKPIGWANSWLYCRTCKEG